MTHSAVTAGTVGLCALRNPGSVFNPFITAVSEDMILTHLR